MNVFVLCTGRCGSMSFARACEHIGNYTAGHETRCHLVGDARLAYPERHIEVDNRLSWYLGRLQRRFGDGACYVHLTREREAVVRSFMKRLDRGIMKAYRDGILQLRGHTAGIDAESLARDYCETVETNIGAFLSDKSNTVRVRLEEMTDDFPAFWERIQARGDLSAALAEFDHRHNRSEASPALDRGASRSLIKRLFRQG